jgi:hypothetical protein
VSAGPTQAATGPVISAAEPTWVRHGSAQTRQDYKVDLAFERVLVSMMSASMSEAAGTGEGEEASGQGLGPLASLLPQALSEGLERDGGLGLAAQLSRTQARLQAHPGAARGTGAGAVSGADGARPVTPAGGAVAPLVNGGVPG